MSVLQALGEIEKDQILTVKNNIVRNNKAQKLSTVSTYLT